MALSKHHLALGTTWCRGLGPALKLPTLDVGDNAAPVSLAGVAALHQGAEKGAEGGRRVRTRAPRKLKAAGGATRRLPQGDSRGMGPAVGLARRLRAALREEELR